MQLRRQPRHFRPPEFILRRPLACGISRITMVFMKTTTETKKEIVTRYTKLIAAAEKAGDTETADRLLVERNRLLGG